VTIPVSEAVTTSPPARARATSTADREALCTGRWPGSPHGWPCWINGLRPDGHGHGLLAGGFTQAGMRHNRPGCWPGIFLGRHSGSAAAWPGSRLATAGEREMGRSENRIRLLPATDADGACWIATARLWHQPPHYNSTSYPVSPRKRWLSLRDRLGRACWMCPSGEALEQKRAQTPVAATAIEFRGPDHSAASRCCDFKEQGTAFDSIQHRRRLPRLPTDGNVAVPSVRLYTKPAINEEGIRPPGPRGLPEFMTGIEPTSGLERVWSPACVSGGASAGWR